MSPLSADLRFGRTPSCCRCPCVGPQACVIAGRPNLRECQSSMQPRDRGSARFREDCGLRRRGNMHALASVGASWSAPGSHWGSQNKHFYIGFQSISASGSFWVCMAASTDHSCSLNAFWKPPGCLLGASWEHLVVLLGPIRCHKMSI